MITHLNPDDNGLVGTNIPFERIRRITGYLTTTVDKWNNAKQAEEHDRVKHSFSSISGSNND